MYKSVIAPVCTSVCKLVIDAALIVTQFPFFCPLKGIPSITVEHFSAPAPAAVVDLLLCTLYCCYSGCYFIITTIIHIFFLLFTILYAYRCPRRFRRQRLSPVNCTLCGILNLDHDIIGKRGKKIILIALYCWGRPSLLNLPKEKKSTLPIDDRSL